MSRMAQTVSEAAIAASARIFETKTYPTDRTYFGTQWFPGPDDDPHITVLNARYLGQYLRRLLFVRG